MQSIELDYLNSIQRVLDEGVMIMNERTGIGCLTVINQDFEIDASSDRAPLITTRKMFPYGAIGEKLGYLRGYTSAAQFRAIGCNTWNDNANKTPAWLANHNRKGEDDIGRSYGPQIREWMRALTFNEMLELTSSNAWKTGTEAQQLVLFDAYMRAKSVDQLRNIYDKLRDGIDDRRLIMTYWNPGEGEKMCLAACMHTHTFSLLDGVLYLTSYQRKLH